MCPTQNMSRAQVCCTRSTMKALAIIIIIKLFKYITGLLSLAPAPGVFHLSCPGPLSWGQSRSPQDGRGDTLALPFPPACVYTRDTAISLGPAKWTSGLYYLATLALTKWVSGLRRVLKINLVLEIILVIIIPGKWQHAYFYNLKEFFHQSHYEVKTTTVKVYLMRSQQKSNARIIKKTIGNMDLQAFSLMKDFALPACCALKCANNVIKPSQLTRHSTCCLPPLYFIHLHFLFIMCFMIYMYYIYVE